MPRALWGREEGARWAHSVGGLARRADAARRVAQVGKEGVITVQDGQTLENELEVVEGMKHRRTSSDAPEAASPRRVPLAWGPTGCDAPPTTPGPGPAPWPPRARPAVPALTGAPRVQV